MMLISLCNAEICNNIAVVAVVFLAVLNRRRAGAERHYGLLDDLLEHTRRLDSLLEQPLVVAWSFRSCTIRCCGIVGLFLFVVIVVVVVVAMK